MSITTSSKQHHLEFLPGFTSEQRKIATVNEFETQFVPLAYLPSKGSVTLDADSLDFQLFYEVGGREPLESFRYKNVLIEVGERTKRIFHIRATFGDPSFRLLIKRVDDIKQAINELARPAPTHTKRNYALINGMVTMMRDKLVGEQAEIELKVFNAPVP